MFSARVPPHLAPNRLSRVLEQRHTDGRSFLDLTTSNPTRAGLSYPSDLLHGLADPRALSYAPQSLGLLEAREAVAADYRRRGIGVAPDRIALTASSSESYSLLFKILCDPGDEVLTPRPSYPLFDYLTRLENVIAVPYDLEYHDSWSIDVESVRARMSDRTRAILLVSPNNPTGSFVKPGELAEIGTACGPRSIALIADEVFADYELEDGCARRSGRPLSLDDRLVFSLGGLSKTVGLPQVKLGWIAANGPAAAVADAMARLELACDTYLSVSTPVQIAAPALLERGEVVRAQIQARIKENARWLSARLGGVPSCRLLHAEGGWSIVLRVPTFGSEEELVMELLERHDVLVHPGYFFDFAQESFLVVSLLTPAEIFKEGMSRVLRHFDCNASVAG